MVNIHSRRNYGWWNFVLPRAVFVSRYCPLLGNLKAPSKCSSESPRPVNPHAPAVSRVQLGNCIRVEEGPPSGSAFVFPILRQRSNLIADRTPGKVNDIPQGLAADSYRFIIADTKFNELLPVKKRCFFIVQPE